MKKPKPPTIVYNPEWTPEGRPRERYRCIEHAAKGLRVVGAVHDIARREGWRFNHEGWYVDNFRDETTHGIVLQLPSRDGKPLYVPACSDPWNDGCCTADFHSTTDTLRDAMHAADGMAERYAEDAREDDAKFQAEQQIEDKRSEICDARKLASLLVADLRTAGHTLPPSTRNVVRSRIRALRSEVERAHERIVKLTENYWEAVT
jgi:hypothetical protein